MSETQLVIGMPAGSLANPNRGGNLISLLDNAGFKTKGYENGGPTTFATTNFLFGWGRPATGVRLTDDDRRTRCSHCR